MGNAEIQMQRMERILEISCELTSTVALEPLLRQIVDAATELTDTETAGILLEHGGELHFVTAALFKEQLADIPVPIESSIAGAAFSLGEAVIVPDVRVDPRYYPIVEQLIGFEARSLLAVPLQFKDRHLGVLEVENKCGDGEFNQQDVETLTVLAAQAAVAIENARLVEALQNAHDLTQALGRASAALTNTLDYETVLDRILEQMSQVISYDAANVMLIKDGMARVFRGHGYEQFGTASDLTSIRFDVADVAGLHQMQQTGRPLVIPDVERDGDWVYSQPEHNWIASYVGVPICIRDQIVGFLNVLSATSGFFDQADAQRLEAFADHVAVAIENAQLYRQAQQELAERVRIQEELRQHRDRLEELVQERTARLELQREIEQSILAAQSPDAIAVAVVRRIRRLIPCQCAAILVVEQAGQIKMLATESSEDTGPLADANVYRELSEGEILRRGGVQGVADLGALSRHSSPQRALFAAGVRSYVIIPLFVQGELLGTLNLVCDQPRAFAAEQIAVATEVAASLAVAIRQAQLYEQSQQEIAEREQVEKALRRSQGQLSAILNSTQQAFVLFDRDYRIRAFNAPAQEHAPALLGTNLQKGAFVRKHTLYDLPSFMTNFGRALSGETVTVENKLKDRDGNDYWVALTFNPVLAESARATGVCLNVSTITARKQAE